MTKWKTFWQQSSSWQLKKPQQFPQLCFKHQILLASIYSQVAISIKVELLGHSQWSIIHDRKQCLRVLTLSALYEVQREPFVRVNPLCTKQIKRLLWRFELHQNVTSTVWWCYHFQCCEINILSTVWWS